MKERWKKFEQSHPKLAKWVYQFLGIQYECYDIPISGIYLFTLFVWKNTGSQRVYVATDSHSHWQHRL